MRKKFLAVAAATVMSMSMAMSAMAAAPTDYTGYYTFDDTLDNSAEGGETATLTGAKVTEAATLTEAKFTEGVDGKAIDMDATYGLKLGKLLTSNQYTVSYDVKVHAGTFGTAGVFIESMNGSAASEQWTSVKPVTSNDVFETGAPHVWNNTKNGKRYNLAAQAHVDSVKAENWFKITFVVDKEVASLYVDNIKVAEGKVTDPTNDSDADIENKIPSNTVNGDTIVWLGVNYWDVPLNAAVDNLYIYDRALTKDELKELVGKDLESKVVEVETMTPALADKNDTSIFQTTGGDEDEKDSEDNTMTIVIVAVVVVAVIVIIVAVVAASKKKKADDDDEE